MIEALTGLALMPAVLWIARKIDDAIRSARYAQQRVERALAGDKQAMREIELLNSDRMGGAEQ
jgi:hypothetical protein